MLSLVTGCYHTLSLTEAYFSRMLHRPRPGALALYQTYPTALASLAWCGAVMFILGLNPLSVHPLADVSPRLVVLCCVVLS